MAEQISIFDGAQPLKITKPIRLIDMFAGYGSQALALKYLGVPFEHHRIAEWAVKSIQAYKDMHFPADKTDYSFGISFQDVLAFLFKSGISADYNKPMTYEQIKRKGEKWCRTVYNNIKSTNNMVSVCNTSGGDLGIEDTDKYTYILTYSFPCQDLSKAGNSAGMKKGSGTRSGLLWEVERILKECNELPQLLVMENVPDVISQKNIADFSLWVQFLDSLGYKSKWKVINGTDFGVPQSRKRCFMVSFLGDYYYDFPEPTGCTLRLKDVLEEEVDQKYYLSDALIDYFVRHTEEQAQKGNSFSFQPTNGDCIGRCITTKAGARIEDNFILDGCECVEMLSGGKWDNTLETSRRVYSTDFAAPTLMVNGGGNQEKKIVLPSNRVRKLTERECFRLMGVRDEDFERVAANQSMSGLYHLAGDSIIVDVLMAIFGEMI